MRWLAPLPCNNDLPYTAHPGEAAISSSTAPVCYAPEMRFPLSGLALLLIAAAGARAGEPIRFSEITRQNPPQRFYVARVDLTDPRVEMVIAPGGPDPDGGGRWETVLRTPSDAAKALQLDLAVNADYFDHQSRDGDPHHFFAGAPARATNLVMIDGRVVTAVQAGAALSFDAQNHPAIASIENARQLPAGTRQAVAGSMVLVQDGKNVASDDDRAPRTAAGIADDGKTLVLLVVDGRRPDTRAGMTVKELAAEMIDLGCRDAINLDGGGSSTMVRKSADGRYKVVNTPSDGSTFAIPLSVERPVPYVLGVRLKP